MQQLLSNLERAYKIFFKKRAHPPRFKKNSVSDSFRYPQGFKLDQLNSRIFLPTPGLLRYRNSRDVSGRIKNVLVSQSCSKWFVSIQTERKVEKAMPNGGAVGIDMGITHFNPLRELVTY